MAGVRSGGRRKRAHAQSWRRAKHVLAGGVNSPVRAFGAVGGTPIFMESGQGAYLADIEGRRYVDFCQSWGALLFGHADAATVGAVRSQCLRGTSFGTVTDLETRLAERIRQDFPSIERLRFTSSGTEAVMSALRLSRGVTGRERIVKFEGGYHGHADSLLVKAGSGLATFGTPDSAGIPRALARLTAVLPYNDSAACRTFLRKNRDVACVIVEPVAGNMGVVPASVEFLETLRRETRKAGALLIFDEVITGYRVGPGGAQGLYGIKPDLTVLGKVIGGGLPVGAFGGRASLMAALSPLGSVYQAGTLSGNPLSMAAGWSVLSRLTDALFIQLRKKTESFAGEAEEVFRRRGIPAVIQRMGSMFTLFFRNGPARSFQDVQASDRARYRKFFHGLLKAGVYFPPSAFEACFLSTAHGSRELGTALKAFERC